MPYAGRLVVRRPPPQPPLCKGGKARPAFKYSAAATMELPGTRPSQSLDPGSAGEPFGEQGLEELVGNIRRRGERAGGRPGGTDQFTNDSTRQAEIPQEVVVRSTCSISRLARGDGQVAADPIEREVVEERAVDKEPVLQPPLGRPAELSPVDGQVARTLKLIGPVGARRGRRRSARGQTAGRDRRPTVPERPSPAGPG